MKILGLLFLCTFHVCGFSQSYEERETTTQEFSQSNPKLVLTKIASDTTIFAELEIRSRYLKRNGILPEIIGFRISASDKAAKALFLSRMIYQKRIPQTALEKLKACEKCTHIYIDRVTIKWFNGTYTLSSSKNWKWPQ